MPRARALVAAALLAAAVSPSAAAGGGERPALLKLGGLHVKWGRPAYGAGAAVSYAFLDQPRSFAGARNCGAMTGLEGLRRASGIEHRAFEGEARAAFALWSAAAAVRFAEVADPDAADILIGAQAEPAGAAFANVARRAESLPPVGAIAKATICLDPGARWELSVDRNPRTFNLRYVLAHEIGHAIGLDHAGRARGVMGFAYVERMGSVAEVRLAATDAAAAAALYGAPPIVLAARSPQTPTPE